uniref:Uncharacterized protein n=1 Tax=Anguilla anguilla TaxID=7936 RepID=A0A0E9Q367_ANGAN
MCLGFPFTGLISIVAHNFIPLQKKIAFSIAVPDKPTFTSGIPLGL